MGPEHNEKDYLAWTTSIDHIRSTPGFRAELWGGDDWPFPMTLESNLQDLLEHAEEFDKGEAFAYTVLDPESRDVIGCVYVDPEADGQARCRLWVKAQCAHLDPELESAVREWLDGPSWDFTLVRFPGRDS